MSDATLEQKFVSSWLNCENPELDGKNPHFGNTYATLKSTLKVIRAACRESGIAYRQSFLPGDTCFMVSSVTDGEEEIVLSRFPVEFCPNPQAFGSNLTYARRQQAQTDWGITGEPDDDGNAGAEDAKQLKPEPVKSRRFERISELKKEALSLGIKEEGIKSWLETSFPYPMKDFTQFDIQSTEAYLEQLIRDKKELDSE